MKVDRHRRLATGASAVVGLLLIIAAVIAAPSRVARAWLPTPAAGCAVISCTTYLPLIMKNYPPAPDLEITQAVQQPDNPVLLIQNRPTYARYTLTSTTPYAGVSAYLYGLRDAAPLPGSPIAAFNNPLTLKSTANRATLNDTFNFQLPAAWLNGSISLYISATNGSTFNLSTGAERIQFSDAAPLNVTLVPIRYTCDNSGSATTPSAPYDYVIDYAQRIYPVPSIALSTHAAIGHTGPCAGGVPDPDIAHWSTLLDAVTAVWQSEGSPNNYYYGLIKVYCPTSCIAGIGWIGGAKAAIGFDGIDTQHTQASETQAHELGHNHGRGHAPGCNADNPDPFFPYVLNGTGRIGDSAHLNFGFDIVSRTIYPYTTDDIMNYCKTQWVSDYTYSALYNYDHGLRPSGSASTKRQPALLISGSIDPAREQVTFRPVFALDAVTRLPTLGDYTLDLLDDKARVIAAYTFTPERAVADRLQTGTAFETTGFHLSVPYAGGLASIRVRRSAIILGTLTAGRRTPRLQAGTSTLSADKRSLQATWSAIDPDGDRLHYLARASIDNGVTWQTLGVNLTSPSIRLPSIDFGGKHVLLEIVASDGIHSTALRLGPFAVANAAHDE